jgi:serine/threonine protein kinase
MGEVWSAEHVTLRMKVAVKVLLPHALTVPEIVARFKREALLLARTRSEFVPRAIDFAVDDTYGPILVTDLVEGECLSTLLKRPVSLEEAIDLGIALATGIADLHRAHVVHRDLKPSNVILTDAEGGPRKAIIIDLGVSRWINDPTHAEEDSEISAITIGDNVVGTLEYMPPEQLLHCAEVTSAADVYALGAILARAVLGRHIFGSLDKVELVKMKLTTDAPRLEIERTDHLAIGLAAVVRRALQRDASNRYPSAEDLRDDLHALRAGPSATCPTGTGMVVVSEPPRKVTAKSAPPEERPRSVYGRLLTALMLIVLVLGIAVCSRAPERQLPPQNAAETPP